ncbi:MAG: hypothetical protein ATN35_11555 [Epulopiscium sp. Nele67-Bin004]|nr:MAG: hypothetical protein ATN35_11555 [Epulopiscium sp. Nele67-Bin004]
MASILTIEYIKSAIKDVIREYNISKVCLFGSYADGTPTEHSDVDIIVEFKNSAISLFTLSALKYDIQDKLNKKVDIIHGALENDSMLKMGDMVVLYCE